jgi:hypothetical protein
MQQISIFIWGAGQHIEGSKVQCCVALSQIPDTQLKAGVADATGKRT